MTEETIMKAVFFDLDDTLLWDEKSVSTAFAETCMKAEKNTGSARMNSKPLYAGQRAIFTHLMKRIPTP